MSAVPLKRNCDSQQLISASWWNKGACPNKEVESSNDGREDRRRA